MNAPWQTVVPISRDYIIIILRVNDWAVDVKLARLCIVGIYFYVGFFFIITVAVVNYDSDNEVPRKSRA